MHNLVAQFTILKDVVRLKECTHTGERSVVVVWVVASSWGDGSVMFTSCDEMLPTKQIRLLRVNTKVNIIYKSYQQHVVSN